MLCQKCTKPRNHCGYRVLLELLGRFELPTSSLPTAVEPSSPCCIRLCGVFLSKKDEVAACLFHCFRPLIFPCGSRCGSGRHLCIKEATDGLRRHIPFGRFSLIIDSGDFLNESFLLLAGFQPRHAEFPAHRKKDTISVPLLNAHLLSDRECLCQYSIRSQLCDLPRPKHTLHKVS